MGWVPELPTISRAKGKDGKERYYLLAAHPFDIEIMLREAQLPVTGIHEQNNPYLTGHYRILRPKEYRQLKKQFP